MMITTQITMTMGEKLKRNDTLVTNCYVEIQSKYLNAFAFFVTQFHTTTVIHTYFETSASLSYYSRCSFFVPSFHCFFLHAMPCSIPSFNQCFYKGRNQSNQRLAFSRLNHSVHCGNSMVPCRALQRKQVKKI
jgi:hypothetical protein